MTEGFEYILALKDQSSKSAFQAKEALTKYKNELKSTDKAISDLQHKEMKLSQQWGRDTAKKTVADEMAKLRQQAGYLKGSIKDLDPPTEKSRFSMGEFASKMFGVTLGAEFALEAVKKLGEGVRWLTEKIVDLVIEGAKWAIEAGAMKEQALATYSLFAGTAEKGKAIFDKIDALGTAIHIPTAKAHEYAKDLLASGIEGTNRLEQTVKSVAMMQKVGGDAAANKIKGLLEETAKTQKTEFWKGGRGTFTVTREQLVGTGVTIDEVYGALAKRMGKNNAQIRQMMMMGQITAAQGIDALNDVIERGKVGDTARKMVGDLSQVGTEIKDNIGKILRDVDFKNFIKEVRGMARIFDPATNSGKTMKDVLVGVFNKIFAAATFAVRALKIGMLELAITSLRFIIFLTPQIKLLKENVKQLKENKSAVAVLRIAMVEFRGTIAGVAIGFKMIVGGVGALLFLWNKLSEIIDYPFTKMKEGWDYVKNLDWIKLGEDLLTALADGLKSGAAKVIDAGKSVGNQLKQGFKDAIGWHSPPKFFLEGGKASADAFAKGGEDTAPSFAKQMMPAMQPARGTGNITITVPINITGVKDAGEAIDQLESRLVDVLNKWAIQFSGGEGAT